MLGEEGPGGQNQAAGRMHIRLDGRTRGFSSKLKPAAWVWSRRWIEGVRSATGRHRSRCRLRGPRQRVPERTERAIRGKKRAILVAEIRGRGLRAGGRDTPIVRSLLLNTLNTVLRTRFVCLGETPSPSVRCQLALFLLTYLLTF